MHCEGLPLENYGLYVLGSLDGPDLDELNSHLQQNCVQCRSELNNASRLWYGVGLAAPQVELRRSLRKRVIALVQESDSFRIYWWQPVAACASLALAVFGGFQLAGRRDIPAPIVQTMSVPGISGLEQENQQLRAALRELKTPVVRTPGLPPKLAPKPPDDKAPVLAELSRQRSELAAIQQELARQKQLTDEANQKLVALASQPKPDSSDAQRQLAAAQLAAAQLRSEQLEHDLSQYKSLLSVFRQRAESPSQAASLLANPNVKVVQLRGTTNGSGVHGHVVLASGSQAVFYGEQMPALPAGRVYQLWLIRSSSPAIVSAGIFKPDDRHRGTVQFSNAPFTSDVTTIAVTDEPEGGSAAPTGHKLLIGS